MWVTMLYLKEESPRYWDEPKAAVNLTHSNKSNEADVNEIDCARGRANETRNTMKLLTVGPERGRGVQIT